MGGMQEKGGSVEVGLGPGGRREEDAGMGERDAGSREEGMG